MIKVGEDSRLRQTSELTYISTYNLQFYRIVGED